MEKLFMSAGVVSAIVLAIVGIVKLPFKGFKLHHPQGYKAVFTGLSICLSAGLAVLNQRYILHGGFFTVDFAILMIAVLSGVHTAYTSYEGLGLKTLVKKIVTAIRTARAMATDKKVHRFLDNIEDIDKAITILVERKTNRGI